MTKGQILRVKINKLAFGGSGIGILEDGKKVFVEGVIPGDVVSARVRRSKKNYVEADLIEVVEPSPSRIKPKCKHFPLCGGCFWQMLPYEEQLKFKQEQVKEALKFTGGFKDTDTLVRPIIGCKDPWFYRNKMEFSFGNSSKDDPDYQGRLHPRGKHIDVFDIEECFLQSEKVAKILARVRDFAKKNNLSFDKLSSLYVRDSKNTGEIMINLVTCVDFPLQKEFVEIFADMPEVVSIYWSLVTKKRGIKTQIQEFLLAGKPTIREELTTEDGTVLKFKISPQAFFQPNTRQAEILYSEAIKAAGLTGAEVVFDLYCGTGTIGLFCAHKAKKIYGLEINESAIKNAKQNAILNGIENSWFKAGDVDKNILEIPDTPDVVIVDPPRAGLGEKVVLKIVDFKPKVVVYVSCDPANLARDLKIFETQGYKVEYVQPVDMFPHTYHIENVARVAISM